MFIHKLLHKILRILNCLNLSLIIGSDYFVLAHIVADCVFLMKSENV